MNFDLRALKAKAKDLAEKAARGATEAAGDWKEKTDRAAQIVADKCTQMTGRETTASEVKKAAIIAAGVVAVGTVALAVAATAPGEALSAVAGAASDGWGSDFESQASRGFAELGGSLNFGTPNVEFVSSVYS